MVLMGAVWSGHLTKSMSKNRRSCFVVPRRTTTDFGPLYVGLGGSHVKPVLYPPELTARGRTLLKSIIDATIIDMPAG